MDENPPPAVTIVPAQVRTPSATAPPASDRPPITPSLTITQVGVSKSVTRTHAGSEPPDEGALVVEGGAVVGGVLVDDGGTLVGAADAVGDAAGGSMVDTGVSTRTDSEAESLHAPTTTTSSARATRRHATR